MIECSCKLWPTPGIYVVTSIPWLSLTRATFRNAEFGFLGVDVYTRVQTPRFCGQLSSAGLEVFHRGGFRPLRTSWLNVGTNFSPPRRASQHENLNSDATYGRNLTKRSGKNLRLQQRGLLASDRPLYRIR